MDFNHMIQECPLPNYFKVRVISISSQVMSPTTTSPNAMKMKSVTNRYLDNKI